MYKINSYTYFMPNFLTMKFNKLFLICILYLNFTILHGQVCEKASEINLGDSCLIRSSTINQKIMWVFMIVVLRILILGEKKYLSLPSKKGVIFRLLFLSKVQEILIFFYLNIIAEVFFLLRIMIFVKIIWHACTGVLGQIFQDQTSHFQL